MKPVIPRGWRRLDDDEIVREGDAYFGHDGTKWFAHGLIGKRAGDTIFNDELPMVRRIANRKPRKPRKTYGQIASDAAGGIDWNVASHIRRKAFQRAAEAVLKAHARRAAR